MTLAIPGLVALWNRQAQEQEARDIEPRADEEPATQVVIPHPSRRDYRQPGSTSRAWKIAGQGRRASR